MKNKFKARPYSLKNKKPFITMKSTKKLTIPIASHLNVDKRSAFKNQDEEFNDSAYKSLSSKFKNFSTIKGVVGNFENSLAKFDTILN